MMSPVLWRVAGKSVCGASHRRRGAPNQDAIFWEPDEGAGIVLAVADGHGSSGSFRSATGSALAVKVAAQVLSEISASLGEGGAAAIDCESIAREVVARWRNEVAGHWTANPIDSGNASTGRNPPWAVYGSTVLAALVNGDRLICLQLGDGDILIVSETGEVSRPWPRDPRCLGVETTSLCGAQAWADVRVMATCITAEAPALVLLATDGYSNSFREDAGFVRIGGDLLEIIRQEGFEKVEDSLEAWLEEASERGSGDDITVGILYRCPVRESGDGD